MSENKDKIPARIICPRQMFGYELKAAIDKEINLGHQVVVCGDFNLEYKSLVDWFRDKGLSDILAKKHGKGPITYQQSSVDPIDCAFGTPSLSIKKRRMSFFWQTAE